MLSGAMVRLCYISDMTNALAKLAELTAQLPAGDRDIVEAKLLTTAEALIAAAKASASERDAVTGQSLSDITVGRTMDLAEFDAEMDSFMDELDRANRS